MRDFCAAFTWDVLTQIFKHLTDPMAETKFKQLLAYLK